MAGHTPKEILKYLARRAFRPAIDDSVREAVESSFAPIQADLAARLAALEASASRRSLPVWRGGLDGCLVPPGDPALEARCRDALATWGRWASNPGSTPAFARGFHETLLEWRLGQLRRLGHWVGVTNDGAMADWCAARSAVEITSCPHPCVSAAAWRWAVAADPLMDGYMRLGLLPPHQDSFAPLVARGESLPLPDGCADVVICDHALTGALDPIAILAEARRVCAPSGLVLVMEDLSSPDADTDVGLDERAILRLAARAGLGSLQVDRRTPRPIASDADAHLIALFSGSGPRPALSSTIEARNARSPALQPSTYANPFSPSQCSASSAA